MSNLPARVIGTIVVNRERGATAIEYGIMVALIAAVIVSTVAVLGGNLSGMISRVATQL